MHGTALSALLTGEGVVWTQPAAPSLDNGSGAVNPKDAPQKLSVLLCPRAPHSALRDAQLPGFGGRSQLDDTGSSSAVPVSEAPLRTFSVAVALPYMQDLQAKYREAAVKSLLVTLGSL